MNLRNKLLIYPFFKIMKQNLFVEIKILKILIYDYIYSNTSINPVYDSILDGLKIPLSKLNLYANTYPTTNTSLPLRFYQHRPEIKFLI